MAKLLADKKTKQLLTDAQIKEKGLQVGNFTANWQGRINIVDPEHSVIAKQLGIQEKGEYAIKIRV
jgi:RNA polymerase subunit RPABC4/transcription elongation factor Spt4